MTEAGRWDVPPEPYPDDRGVRARMLPGPVLPPEQKPRRSEPKPRRSGDPHCPECQPGHACQDHLGYLADPLAGIA